MQRKVTGLCACVCLWPLDAEKSDGKKIRHRTEHQSTTVGWRAFVCPSRSWNPGPESACVCWGLETQCPFIEVLKPRSWEPNVATRASRPSRSWNPGPESACVCWGPKTQCPFIEILKPRSWEPNAATRACRHGRIVFDRHGYSLVSRICWKKEEEGIRLQIFRFFGGWVWGEGSSGGLGCGSFTFLCIPPSIPFNYGLSIYGSLKTIQVKEKKKSQARADCVRPSRVPIILKPTYGMAQMYTTKLTDQHDIYHPTNAWQLELRK
jgi:hypothetical protein